MQNLLSGVSRITLCLTYISTFQQKHLQKIREKRLELRGKLFKVHLNKPKFCGKYKAIFVKNINSKKVIELSPLSCWSWTCPVCGPKKAISTKYFLRDVIQINKLTRFLTLTLDPKKIPYEYFHRVELTFKTIVINRTHEYITKLLNLFILNIKRKYLKKQNEVLKYVWVIEFQKNGMAHLHMVVNQFLPIKLLRKEWARIGGGVQMHIAKVKSLVGVSSYIGDYIVKGFKNEFIDTNLQAGFKYNERRYSVSRSCIKPKYNKILSINKLPEEDKNEVINSLGLTEEYNNLKKDQ